MKFSSSLGVAVIGTGFIGPVHIEAIRRLGHRVIGVLGSTLAKSQETAVRLTIEKTYADLDELLADETLSVVHVASPNRFHYEQCLKVIAAGKHIICEKPLAMTVAEAQQLVAAAKARPGLVAAVNYNVRFYPMILAARERLRQGEFGRVFHVFGSYLQDWLLEPTDYNWRVEAEAGGALRAVADIGTHWLDTIQFLIRSRVVAVFANLQTVHETRHKPVGGRATFTKDANQETISIPVTTEDAGTILLRFDNGAMGCLSVSQVMAGRKNTIRFDVAAELASLAWDSEEPNTLRLGRRTQTELWQRDPGTMPAHASIFTDYPAGHAEGFPDTFKQLYRAVYADILAGGPSEAPLYATFADGLHELELCEAIRQSAAEQRWVSLA